MIDFATSIKQARLAKLEAADVLRRNEETFAIEKARAETQIITAAGGSKALGSNEADRDRAMIVALADLDRLSTPYGLARANLEQARYGFDFACYELDCALDGRRDYENSLKERALETVQL